MKVSKKFIILLIIIAILLLGVAIFGYYIKKNDKTSYSVFVDTFDNFLEIINNQTDVNSNSIEGNISLESNSISYNEYRTLLNIFGGNNIDLDFKINYEKRYAMLDMQTFYTDIEPINIKKYYDSIYVYSYIENYYDNKFVRRNLFVDEYNSFIDSIKISKDYINILTSLKKAFLCKENSIFFHWTEQQIKIENEDYKSYSNYIILDKKIYIEFFKNVNIILKNDSDFLKSYKSIFKKDFNIEDYRDFVNWFQNNSININIYSDMLNNKFLKLVLMVNNNDDLSKSTSIELYKSGDTYKFKFLRDLYTVNGNIKIGKNTGEIELNIPTDSSEVLNMKLKYNYKYKNDIDFEPINNYVDRFDVLDKTGDVYQAMIDRREISNANTIYNWYITSR